MEEIVKMFRHLARDVFFYLLSGGGVILNLFYLDHLYNNSNSIRYIYSLDYSFLYIIFVSYTVGHLVSAIMYCLIEKTRIEEVIKRCFENNVVKDVLEKELFILKKEPVLYEQFIERYNQLSLMRWNLSGSFMICSVINFAFLFCLGHECMLIFLTVILFFGGIVLYILSLKTEKDCHERVQKIFDL